MRWPAIVEDVRVVPVRGERHRSGDHVSKGEQAPAEHAAAPSRNGLRHVCLQSAGRLTPRYVGAVLTPRGRARRSRRGAHFDTAGTYRLWGQFRLGNGHVITVPFTLTAH